MYVGSSSVTAHGTRHAVLVESVQTALVSVMAPTQQFSLPPGKEPQPVPPQVPHEAAQHTLW